MEFSHRPVLLEQTIAALDIKPDGIYVDGTAGGAGHSSEIAKRLGNGFLYALDRDPDAVKTASERLKGFPAKVIQSNFPTGFLSSHATNKTGRKPGVCSNT